MPGCRKVKENGKVLPELLEREWGTDQERRGSQILDRRYE